TLVENLFGRPPTLRTTRSDAQGRFRLELASHGSVRLRFEAAGHVPLERTVVAEHSPYRLPPVHLDATRRLAGTLRWDDGSPVHGGQVLVFENAAGLPIDEARADEDGAFEVELGLGSYRLWATGRAVAPELGFWRVATSVAIGEEAPPRFSLQVARPRVTLQGSAVHEGLPVAGTEVRVTFVEPDATI